MKLYTRFLLLVAVLFAAPTYGQSIAGVSHSPIPTRSCDTVLVTTDLVLGCTNYTLSSVAPSVSGTTLVLDIQYTIGPICLGALYFPSHVVDFGVLNQGTYDLEVSLYVNGILEDSIVSLGAVNVTSCCATGAGFAPSLAKDSICYGDTLSFVNSSLNATSYEWYLNGGLESTDTNWTTRFTNPGWNRVRLIAFGQSCEDSSSFDVYVDSLHTIDLGADTVICSSDSLQLSVPSGYSSVSWSTGEMSSSIWVSEPGTYSVSWISRVGCAYSDTLRLDTANCSVSVSEYGIGSGFKVFPNPTQGQVQLTSLPSEVAQVELLDAMGRVVSIFSKPEGTDSMTLSLTELASGLYTIRVRSSHRTQLERLQLTHP